MTIYIPPTNTGSGVTQLQMEQYVTRELDGYLSLSGGNLTGDLNGTSPTQISYSDTLSSNIQTQINALTTDLGTFLPLMGGILTGNLNSITPTQLSYLTTLTNSIEHPFNRLE